MSFAPNELLVEVADDVQEIVMDDSRVWPECLHHKAGLTQNFKSGSLSWVVARHEDGATLS
jgi:hypothetical protein